MAETIPVKHCPKISITSLPNKAVTTYDGHKLTLGSIVYFRYSPGPAASEYAVVSDHALRETAGYRVAVVGPTGIAGWMNVKDLVHDIKEWWTFYKKAYEGAAQSKVEENNDEGTRTPPTTRKRGNRD